MSKYRNNEIDNFAEVFKALSNPNRLRIFMRLMSCCKKGVTYDANGRICACVGELGRDLKIAPSTLSHHVKELRRVGLIHIKRRGQKMECWVEPDVIEGLTDFLAEGSKWKRALKE